MDSLQEPQTSGADESHEQDIADEEKIAVLIDVICRAGDEPTTKSAALLVLMATVENSSHPKALANVAKHLGSTRCGELNVCGIIDAQISMLEADLFSGDALAA